MGFDMGPKLEAGTGAELVARVFYCLGCAIVSNSCYGYCTSRDAISSSIGHSEVIVTLDYSLALEISITISFGSQSQALVCSSSLYASKLNLDDVA